MAVSGSSFGDRFRITTFGESHGGAVGVVVDGCPPRLAIDADRIQADLDRRRPGQSRLVSQRQEPDTVEILSGIFEGHTLGTPIAMLVRNTDAMPSAYEHMRDLYRPSHADYTTEAKYGTRDWQGGGRASARETIGRVAAAAIARQLLETTCGIEVLAWVASVGDITADVDPAVVTLDGRRGRSHEMSRPRSSFEDDRRNRDGPPRRRFVGWHRHMRREGCTARAR